MGLAGCLSLPRTQRAAIPTEEQVFDGTLEVVSRNTEEILRKRGIHFVSEPDGEGLRIQATTERNGHFTLFLTREVVTKKGEKVRVRIQWDSGPRESIHWFLFGTLDALPPA